MAQDLIRYDLMVQDALKGVVRKVLTDAASHGMPGDHHFYISFRTQDAGVRISQRLRDKYADEMTIVLQHQFWDLVVTEHAFEVGLAFSSIPERLLVPFDSLTGFFDPSVQFGLKFEATTSEPADNDEDGEGSENEEDAPVSLPPARRSDAPPKAAAAEPAPAAKLAARQAEKSTEAGGRKGQKDRPAPAKAEAKPDGRPDAKTDGAEVVSLDAFRKKT